MSHTLFDQVLHRKPARQAPRWMRLGSLAIHLAIALFVIARTVTTALELPVVYARLPTVVLAAPAPPPAAPAPPPPSTATAAPVPVSIVPLAPPEGVHPEVPPPPVNVLAAPGGIDGSLPALGTAPISTVQPPPLPAPPPVAPRPVGGNVRRPERIVFVEPVYPPAARAARMEGTVIVDAVIDEAGVVTDVTVLRSVPLLDRAALEAVRQWRYTPTQLNGEPIPVRMTVSVRFSLR